MEDIHQEGDVTLGNMSDHLEQIPIVSEKCLPKVDLSNEPEKQDSDISFPMPPRPNPHIPTNEEERHHLEQMHGCDSWQCKIMRVLHSKHAQYTLMALLLLDVIILFVELFLSAHYPLCTFVIRDAISCCPVHNETGTYLSFTESDVYPTCAAKIVTEEDVIGRFRYLTEDKKDSSICEAGYETYSCPAACDEHKYETVHHVETALFYCTVLILCIFLVELMLVMICLKPTLFFRKGFYVLDLFVVLTSLVLELFFHMNTNESIQNLVGAIILARLWRFVRIGHGLVEVTHEYASRKHDKLVQYSNKLETLLMENGIGLPPHHKQEISKLKKMDSYH